MDAQRLRWAEVLLDFPDTPPYSKFDGTHWRLVELADLGVELDRDRVWPGVDHDLAWITSAERSAVIPPVHDAARRRLHGSIEGNSVYAAAMLGFGDDPRVAEVVDRLLASQWPDGGWNCDRNPEAWRSSFHETVTPAMGLAVFAQVSGRADALDAARRAAELLLEHRLFRRDGSGDPIHPTWTELHDPPYWHYDILQGLRLLDLLGLLGDERAADALELLRSMRRADGTYPVHSWASSEQPAAVDYGPGAPLLAERANAILASAERAGG